MDNYQTIEKLRQMRLSAMAELHLQHIKNNKSNDATPDEYLALLTEHEWDSRQNQKVNRLIKQAGFKQKADIAGVDYTAPRNLDKNMFNRLATLDFIKRKENIIITGASGVGKSYLAQAIGHHACVTGDRVIYTNTARLFTRLKLSKTDGTYIKELIKLQKVNLVEDIELKVVSEYAEKIGFKSHIVNDLLKTIVTAPYDGFNYKEVKKQVKEILEVSG
jgi:DNA replication protein DnaC